MCTSVDKVSHFKSLTRLRDFFIKSHEIYETFETLETWNLHHKYSVNLFGRSPKCYIFIKNPTILTHQSFLLHFYASSFSNVKNFVFFEQFPCQKHPKLLNNDFWDFLEKSHETFETFKSLVSSETFETCQHYSTFTYT